MKVKMTSTAAGPNPDGPRWNRDDILDFPDATARQLISDGAAVEYTDEAQKRSEPAPDLAARIPVTEPAEVRAARTLAEEHPKPKDAPPQTHEEDVSRRNPNAMRSDDERRLVERSHQVKDVLPEELPEQPVPKGPDVDLPSPEEKAADRATTAAPATAMSTRAGERAVKPSAAPRGKAPKGTEAPARAAKGATKKAPKGGKA
jgi:hypothetical protein